MDDRSLDNEEKKDASHHNAPIVNENKTAAETKIVDGNWVSVEKELARFVEMVVSVRICESFPTS